MAPYRWGARMEAMGTSRRRRRDCRICPEMLIAQAFTAIALVQLNTDQGNPVGSFTHREPCSAVKLYKHAPTVRQSATWTAHAEISRKPFPCGIDRFDQLGHFRLPQGTLVSCLPRKSCTCGCAAHHHPGP